MSGENVKALQHALNRVGIGVKYGVDGYFGSATQASVKAFQRYKGLAITGVVDAATAKALGFAATATGRRRHGADGATTTTTPRRAPGAGTATSVVRPPGRRQRSRGRASCNRRSPASGGRSPPTACSGRAPRRR